MAEADAESVELPKKRSLMPLLGGLVAALVAAGGGYLAVSSGLLFSAGSDVENKSAKGTLDDIAFVAIDPLTISLGPSSTSRHLRFEAQLEIDAAYEEDVTKLMPRIVDVLNSYLRAIEIRDVEEPAALVRLRAQMLRRVQIVTGEGRVRDLLIMEFVLN